MKYHHLLFVFTLSQFAFAESPKAFTDVPFGASLEEARAALTSRKELKPGEVSATLLTFTGGTFSGQPVSHWTFKFVGNKFALGSAHIDNVKKPVYDDLKDQLTKKYGKPDSEKGHNSYECRWVFRSNGQRTIRLDYDYKGKVDVTYTLDSLAKAGEKEDL